MQKRGVVPENWDQINLVENEFYMIILAPRLINFSKKKLSNFLYIKSKVEYKKPFYYK